MMDTVLHRVLDTLGDVKEAVHTTFAPGTHITSGGVCGLMEHLQLRLHF